MIIDFHTHIFPEKIASRTIEMLAASAKIDAHSDGTVTGLIEKMKDARVDISVAMPVITNPAQFESINRFAAEINAAYGTGAKRIISFGGIHPDCDDIEGKMKKLKELGFLGIKLHPEYQDTFINDEKYVRIVECARDNDMIVLTHTGFDGAFTDREMRSPPELMLELVRRVPYSKTVLAHLGANKMMRESYELLAGENVYFDTGYMLPRIDGEMFRKLVAKHGEDKVLFATDSPWTDIADGIERIRSFGLSKEAEDKILAGNAKKLLGI